eukprot:SAG11_NODE_538_length_8664_cov_5.830590_9_plen_277_part_00
MRAHKGAAAVNSTQPRGLDKAAVAVHPLFLVRPIGLVIRGELHLVQKTSTRVGSSGVVRARGRGQQLARPLSRRESAISFGIAHRTNTAAARGLRENAARVADVREPEVVATPDRGDGRRAALLGVDPGVLDLAVRPDHREGDGLADVFLDLWVDVSTTIAVGLCRHVECPVGAHKRATDEQVMSCGTLNILAPAGAGHTRRGCWVLLARFRPTSLAKLVQSACAGDADRSESRRACSFWRAKFETVFPCMPCPSSAPAMKSPAQPKSHRSVPDKC